jgi:CDGSH-type Zn-finger protein/uncharacterized Fe-S cluster protein YjdI
METIAMPEKIHEYKTDPLTVQYNAKRCIHAAECVRRLPRVFDANKRPWVQPGNAEANAVAGVVVKCPTGALHFTRSDEGPVEHPDKHNTLTIVANGPVYVRGDLELCKDIPAADSIETPEIPLHETRMALCRCGASGNKPFCDNSHHNIAFEHDGRYPEDKIRIGEIEDGGRLVITPTRNGSIKVEGNFEIIDASGQTIYKGTKTWLCRCGGSASKPFCDGTHNKNGFTAE